MKFEILNETPLVQLYNEDCLEVLKSMADNSIQLIVTDPPYNIGDNSKLCKQGNNIISNKEMWGHFEPKDEKEWYEFLNKLFIEFYRVCSGSIYLFYDRMEITRIKDMLKDVGYHPKNLLGIIKRNPLPHFRKNGFRSDFELCIFCQKEKGKDTFNFLNQDVMKSCDFYTIGNKITTHPSEKPLKVIKKYISISSNEGDIILDPFLGSGTTGEAAYTLKRNFIGIEVNKEYYDMSKKRLKDTSNQPFLF